MDINITNFIITQREKALLIGDYASYRKQLSRRLLVVRKKLHYTSAKGKKYTARPAVTSDHVSKNHEYVQIQTLICKALYRNPGLYTYSCFFPSEHGP